MLSLWLLRRINMINVNELLKLAIKEIENLIGNEIFLVKDLFKG